MNPAAPFLTGFAIGAAMVTTGALVGWILSKTLHR